MTTILEDLPAGHRLTLSGPILEVEPLRQYIEGKHDLHALDPIGTLLVGCPDCEDTIRLMLALGGWTSP